MALGSNIPQPESISGSPPGWPMMVRAGGWFQGAALPSFTGRTFSYYFCMVCQEFFFARQERARRGHPVTCGHGHSHGALARQFGRCGNRGREGGKIKGKGRRSLGADGIRLKQKATKTPVSRHECLENRGLRGFRWFLGGQAAWPGVVLERPIASCFGPQPLWAVTALWYPKTAAAVCRLLGTSAARVVRTVIADPHQPRTPQGLAHPPDARSVGVVMFLGIVPGMVMMVFAMVAGMVVIVNIWRAAVDMFVQVLVQMLMFMAMGVFMTMNLPIVGVFVAVSVTVFMAVQMAVLVFSFHGGVSFFVLIR